MSKVILILDDMPNNCYECPLCVCDVDYDYICSALTIKAKDDYTSDKYEVIKCKEWLDEEVYSKCPLKPLPSREDIYEEIYQAYGLGKEEPYERMRDAVDKVLDEILGEKNETN